MNTPEVGDIWRWHSVVGQKSWTVLLLRRIHDDKFEGIALEDGWRGPWEFAAQFGGKLCGWWELVA